MILGNAIHLRVSAKPHDSVHVKFYAPRSADGTMHCFGSVQLPRGYWHSLRKLIHVGAHAIGWTFSIEES